MAFGDVQDCYHTKVSKNGKCKKCGKQVNKSDEPTDKDK